jgi:hypothetical protein
MANKAFKLFVVFHKPSLLPKLDYVVPIQAGAANNPKELAPYTDNKDEHIGHLNKYFAELTAMYSIYKNNYYGQSNYWGLVHYRRYFAPELHWTRVKKKIVFDLPFNEVVLNKIFSYRLKLKIWLNLAPNKVIVPRKAIILNDAGERHTIKSYYAHNHKIEDWNLFEATFKEKFPEYYESFVAVGNQTEMLFYNMMIAHKDVWEAYCKWAFEIMFEVFNVKKDYEEGYQNKVFGFFGERLLQVYLYHHKEKYTIKYFAVARLDFK